MNTKKLPISSNTLPLKQSLKGDYVLIFIITLLVAVSSISGLLASRTLYPIEELRNGFVTTDVINLLLVLPLLVGGYVLTRRSSLVGLIFWIGSLFVLNYHYIAYASAHLMSWQFIMYITLVGLTAWAIFSLIRRVDLPEIKEQLAGAVPVRLTAGVLIILGLLFILRAGDIIIKAFAADKMLPPTEIADFISSTIWIIGGVILWQKKALGYVVGAGLILQASLLFVGLLIYFFLQPIVANSPFPLEDFIVIFFMGWVCYIPFVLFVRGIITRSKKLYASNDKTTRN
jgi:hypothetical protein